MEYDGRQQGADSVSQRVTLQEYPQGMPPPGLLRSWCDSQSYFGTMSITEMPSEEDMQTESKSETALQLTDKSMTDLDSVTVSSTNSCRAVSPINFRSRDRAERAEKSFKYLSGFLRIAITVSFSLSKGAGGFSIAPSLSVRAIVRYHGSTLNIQFTKLVREKPKEKHQLQETVNNCIGQMQQVFSTGKSRPTDLFYHDDGPIDYTMISFVDVSDMG